MTDLTDRAASTSAWLLAAGLLAGLAATPARAADPAPALTLTDGQASGVFHVAYSPDGRLLASCGKNGTIKIRDADGKDVRTLTGTGGTVYSAAFSPDGKRLAAGSEDQQVRVWNVADGKELLAYAGHTASVYHVVFSPDGKLIASAAGDHHVKVWDAETGELVRTLTGHTDRVLGVSFSPDGRRLATSCGTSSGSGALGGEVKIWDVPTGLELFTIPTRTAGVLTVAFSPDGKRLAGACLSGGVRVWETATGRETLHLQGHSKGTEVYFVAFSPDGRRLASCSGKWNEEKAGEVKVWDLAEGREVLSLGGYTAPVWSLGFRPDGKMLATATGKWNAGDGGAVRVWDVSALLKPAPARALTPKDMEELWADLASPDPQKAYRAVWLLGNDPTNSVSFLRERAGPPNTPNPLARLPKLIADLDADDFDTREKATEELARLGTAAHPALRKALESESAEVRRRAAALLEKKGEPPPLAADELRAIRVVEIAQHIGTSEAEPILRKLAGASAGTPTQLEAAAALERCPRK
jgi:hypothetical protein